MKNEIKDYKDFLQRISDEIHFFCKDFFPDDFVLACQITLKFALLTLLVYVVSFILKNGINLVFRFFFDKEKYPVMKSIYQAKVTNSVANILALIIGKFALYSIFYRHPKSFDLLERMINFVIVLAIANMAFRFIKVLQNYYLIQRDYYKIIAINSISQTVRIFGMFIFSVIAICVIFNISGTTVLGSLGAITAVIVLIFRDTILGFVTGIHVATSKNLKVGDWVAIPKYSIEGNIEDIDLLTTKIRNFDKTLSTIPTYDLLTTEIKNMQVMSETNTRRIKKSIVFNIKSFKFLDDEAFGKLLKINLIHDYLVDKKKEIDSQKGALKNSEEIINGQQLTNIGTFRIYALNYLKNNHNIDQEGTIMVRQMEITPQGMPLEIYCFANDSNWVNFEQIQADIFDHLLVASKEFDLEIMQVNKI
ncbi:mechanosensitive ion channel family protein [Epilithonimonas arachidiradicis]|uniref:Miniconductance mechanosensitive channel n=1 Tax=Epilithonimonas arachidiradicis TaxID=1617282 RepID=A0A420DB09_9FLAO|nr:mechanosensitive ion channel domain-containing protein [Epilithonimonas arachidiradicis]RKE88383.1 miniconductance mechanosensitive channel [Epilithonimonas arachidiradicis]GGG49326.1 small conductance mechanosensitive ion channel protein YbdG [Epilithonimonas arachidiradicis]